MMFDKFQLIDLTHPLNPTIPTWDGTIGFKISGEEDIFLRNSSGTHMDMPAYFDPKGYFADTLPLEKLCTPAYVLDLSKTANVDTIISPQEVHSFEEQHGRISQNSLVIAYTGWSRKWNDTKAYRNNLRFPTWGIPALELLLQRKIAGVAIDTLALEVNEPYPGHKLLMNAGKYIIENIANCHCLPPTGSYVIALPLKIQDGSEAPARVIALVPKTI